MSHKLILYDRSRVTTDWTCPRKRYWQYEYNGKGVVSGHSSLELFAGTVIHDGLAAIATQHQSNGGVVDIDAIAEACFNQMRNSLLETSTGEIGEVDFALEQGTLVEGLLRGFYKHAWPRLISAYPTIVHIEKEMTFEHVGLTFMSRPDLILADAEGNQFYIEYKSTSSKKEGWVNSWATAVQLHSTVRAIQATTGELPMGVVVQGLYKGYESYGKQNSPFCYAFSRKGNPPFTQDEIRYDFKAGFKRIPVWEMPGGVRAWVESMPLDLLGDQFPQVPPIFINEGLVDSFFNQRGYREHEIQMALDLYKMAEEDPDAQVQILNTAFPQRFDQCHPYFGRPCTYLRMCHAGVTNPLENGYIYREPHHEAEVNQDKEN